MPGDGGERADLPSLEKSCCELGVNEIRLLKLLEEENRRLKQQVADLGLDKLMLQDAVYKKIVRPERRGELVRYVETYRVCERR